MSVRRERVRMDRIEAIEQAIARYPPGAPLVYCRNYDFYTPPDDDPADWVPLRQYIKGRCEVCDTVVVVGPQQRDMHGPRLCFGCVWLILKVRGGRFPSMPEPGEVETSHRMSLQEARDRVDQADRSLQESDPSCVALTRSARDAVARALVGFPPMSNDEIHLASQLLQDYPYWRETGRNTP